jgi:energy-coupling factor transport system ATP-binding protein
MEDCLEREPHTLSGGQKQRVAIAGILAMNCDIVILDEATSMLDPQGVSDITKLIVELKEKYHKTIITITHDLDLAGLSDRIIVMKEGNIISEGKPEEIFKERHMLKSSNLDMPFGLRMYDEASKIEKLKNNEQLMEALWEYHLKG